MNHAPPCRSNIWSMILWAVLTVHCSELLGDVRWWNIGSLEVWFIFLCCAVYTLYICLYMWGINSSLQDGRNSVIFKFVVNGWLTCLFLCSQYSYCFWAIVVLSFTQTALLNMHWYMTNDPADNGPLVAPPSGGEAPAAGARRRACRGPVAWPGANRSGNRSCDLCSYYDIIRNPVSLASTAVAVWGPLKDPATTATRRSTIFSWLARFVPELWTSAQCLGIWAKPSKSEL